MNNLYDQLNVCVFGKDTQGKFIYSNDRFAEAAGLDSAPQIIGKTDRDLVWREDATVFEIGDRWAMRGNPFINVVESMHQCQKIADILVSKCQLLNKRDECIGVIGSFIDITGNQIQPKCGYYDPVTQCFHLGEQFNNEYLTKQQYRVFKKILLGYPAPRIANQLNISTRTVEGHILNIKHKLQCSTKGQLIEIALKAGLNHLS